MSTRGERNQITLIDVVRRQILTNALAERDNRVGHSPTGRWMLEILLDPWVLTYYQFHFNSDFTETLGQLFLPVVDHVGSSRNWLRHSFSIQDTIHFSSLSSAEEGQGMRRSTCRIEFLFFWMEREVLKIVRRSDDCCCVHPPTIFVLCKKFLETYFQEWLPRLLSKFAQDLRTIDTDSTLKNVYLAVSIQ